jgi:hypothetical protein
MAKHRAVVLMHIDLCEVLETGESSGHAMTRDELKEVGLNSNLTVAVEGDSKEECIARLKEKINGFRT